MRAAPLRTGEDNADNGSRRAARIALALSAAACLVGFAALAVEARISYRNSFARGRGLTEATFLYLRYFTITTNIALVALHATTALRLARERRLPPGAIYNAWAVYAVVTCVTYELLLRSSWTPRGEEFLSDMMLHDAVPLLTLVIWWLVAPRTGVRWRDAFAMLAYPAAFLAVTLVAGAYGEGYPYDFLNVAKIGLANVLLVSLIFLVVFLALGTLVTALAKWRASIERDSAPRLMPSIG